MSKGLGWLEKAILEAMETEKHEPCIFVITDRVFRSKYGLTDQDFYFPTNAQLKSTYRAVKSLARKQMLVIVKVHLPGWYSDLNRGGTRKVYVFPTEAIAETYLESCPPYVRRLEMPDGRILSTKRQKESDEKVAELVRILR